MRFLLDTNVLSEMRKPRPSANVSAFISATPTDRMFTSVVVLSELRYGITLLTQREAHGELQAWLDLVIRMSFRDRILVVDEDVMFRWRLLLEEGKRHGKTLPQPDLIIAAQAIEHGMTLVTRNVKDFRGLPLTILNPWES